MTKIKELESVFFILIRLGVVFRVSYCLLMVMHAEHEADAFKKKAKNAVVFLVLAEVIKTLLDLSIKYFS